MGRAGQQNTGSPQVALLTLVALGAAGGIAHGVWPRRILWQDRPLTSDNDNRVRPKCTENV